MIATEQILRFFRRTLLATIIAFAALAVVPKAAAQYESLALGIEIGSPTAVTVLVPTDHRYAFEFLGAWDLDDYLFFNAHALLTKNVEDYPNLHAIWGVGAFIGLHDNRSDQLSLGVSGKFGAGYSLDPFEVYVHLTPRFEIISETDFHLGGGIGLRFYTGRS